MYDNPRPVAVNIQPVFDKDGRLGLAIAQRALGPFVGGWALVGGHIENNGETVEQGGEREFSEETSRNSGGNARLVTSYANGVGHLLIAIEHDPIAADYYMAGTPCHENLALGIMWEPEALCFSIHTEIAQDWFRRKAGE